MADILADKGVMHMKFSGYCPVCGEPLRLARLSCPDCKAEFPVDETFSPYDCLSTLKRYDLLSHIFKCL